nr:hypothetical protein [Tanacetum cinerariifolium]
MTPPNPLKATVVAGINLVPHGLIRAGVLGLKNDEAMLAVAFVGYTSNNILVDRLDTTRLIGTLNDAAQDVRLSEKQYEASADPAALEAYRTQLGTLQGLISKALLSLTRAENQLALTQLQTRTVSYDQKVNRLVDTDKSTSDSLKPLTALSDKFGSTFAQLLETTNARALEQPGTERVAELRTVADLRNGMTMFRLVLRRYIAVPDATNKAALLATTDGFLNEIVKARTSLPAALSAQLEEAYAGMRQYRDVLVQVAALFEQKQSLRQQVDQESDA